MQGGAHHFKDRCEVARPISLLFGRFDYIVAKERRDVQLAEMRRVWSELPKEHLPPPPAGVYVDAGYELVMSEVEPLLALKSDKMIHIGE